MQKVLLILIFTPYINSMAQTERFFDREEAKIWLAQLIGTNEEFIAQYKECTDSHILAFSFLANDATKLEQLKTDLNAEFSCTIHNPYQLENKWYISGVLDLNQMDLEILNEHTMSLFKSGYIFDIVFLGYNLVDKAKLAAIDNFWSWFIKNKSKYYNINPDLKDELKKLFKDLHSELKLINPDLVFLLSPILGNNKREFILSVDGKREAFSDLLLVYEKSPELENWIFVPFKPNYLSVPQIVLDNGYELTWDKIKFNYEIMDDGLKVDFYIKDLDQADSDQIRNGVIILIDNFLGEYDAVVQVREISINSMQSNIKNVLSFNELEKVVEEHKQQKHLFFRNTKQTNSQYYPFKTNEESPLLITAQVEGELFDTYFPFFNKLGYSGNGYCWESHIIQILEKTKPKILTNITFDPEAGAFYALARDIQSKDEFLEILCPIFSDLNLLEKYVKSADPNRIDD